MAFDFVTFGFPFDYTNSVILIIDPIISNAYGFSCRKCDPLRKPKRNILIDSLSIRYDHPMNTSPEPISVRVTVLAQTECKDETTRAVTKIILVAYT
jgi:hypothetical protein